MERPPKGGMPFRFESVARRPRACERAEGKLPRWGHPVCDLSAYALVHHVPACGLADPALAWPGLEGARAGLVGVVGPSRPGFSFLPRVDRWPRGASAPERRDAISPPFPLASPPNPPSWAIRMGLGAFPGWRGWLDGGGAPLASKFLHLGRPLLRPWPRDSGTRRSTAPAAAQSCACAHAPASKCSHPIHSPLHQADAAEAAAAFARPHSTPLPDISRFLRPTGLMEARHIRMLSSLCALTYAIGELTVSCEDGGRRREGEKGERGAVHGGAW